jgi:hypothetical protein
MAMRHLRCAAGPSKVAAGTRSDAGGNRLSRMRLPANQALRSASALGSFMAPDEKRVQATSDGRRVLAFVIFAASLAAFIAALEVAYALFMAPRFGYLGYDYQEPDRAWMVAAFLLLIAVSFFLPYRPERFSGYAVWFLYASLLVPVATVPLYGGTRAPQDSFAFAMYCAAIWIGVALAVRRPAGQYIPVAKSTSHALWAAVIVLSLATYAYLASVFGITFNLMSVFDIAETRLHYRDELVPTVPLLGYLIANQGNVVNPFLMAYGAVRRRWMLAGIGAVGQLVLYSTGGFKTVLLSIPLCILLALFMRKRKSILGMLVVASTAVLGWVSMAVDTVLSVGVVDVLVARVFMVAGYLMPMYRDAYDTGEWALWDHSFLAPFVSTPYTVSPGFYVSMVSLNRPDVQLNGSLVADGYANLGLLGIAIEAAFLVILLRLADSASRGLPMGLVLATGLLPVFTLGNVSPFTALFSSGLGLIIVLFALYPRDQSTRPVTPDRSLMPRRGPA